MNVTEIREKYQADESMEEFTRRLQKSAANSGKISVLSKKLDGKVAKLDSLANEFIALQKEIDKDYHDLNVMGGDNFSLPGKVSRINQKVKAVIK